MTARGARWTACALCGLAVVAAVAHVALAIADPHAAGPAQTHPAGPSPDDMAAGGYVPYAAFSAVVFCTFAVVGAVVAARRPRNPVGWCIVAGALLWTLAEVDNAFYWHLAFGRTDAPVATHYLAWFASCAFAPAFVLMLALLPLLFPTGSPPGPRWRGVVWLAVAAGIGMTVGTAFAPGPMTTGDFPWIDNPLGIGGLGLGVVARVSWVGLVVAVLAGLTSLVVRYRRARGIERQQLRWVAAAGCLLVVSAVVGSASASWLGDGAGWIGILLGLLAVAVAMAISLLRYRLYDLDVVIKRTLVYGALSATLAGVYAVTVVVLEAVLSPSSPLTVAASTLAVAALFRPALARIQSVVDRRFYRRRYDARQTLEAFGARLREEIALDTISGDLHAVVTETLQPEHVSLWLREPGARP